MNLHVLPLGMLYSRFRNSLFRDFRFVLSREHNFNTFTAYNGIIASETRVSDIHNIPETARPFPEPPLSLQRCLSSTVFHNNPLSKGPGRMCRVSLCSGERLPPTRREAVQKPRPGLLHGLKLAFLSAFYRPAAFWASSTNWRV